MNRLTKSSNNNELYVVDHEIVNPDTNGYSGKATHIYGLGKYGWKFVLSTYLINGMNLGASPEPLTNAPRGGEFPIPLRLKEKTRPAGHNIIY